MKSLQVLTTREVEIDGKVYKVPLYSEGKKRPDTSMRLRGQQTSDAKLLSGVSEGEISKIEKEKKKKVTVSILDRLLGI